MAHLPVLLREILQGLNIRQGSRVVDATVNGGGHSKAILEVIASEGALLGIEWDRDLANAARTELEKTALGRNVRIVNDTFARIREIVEEQDFAPVDGVLFDLGFSSYHVDESGRGFSFQKNEPLDMRYYTGSGYTAAEFLQGVSKEELERVLKEFGEERFFRRIAAAIVEARKKGHIQHSEALVEIVRRAVPPAYRRGRIHFATRTFQALRIAVNREFENIRAGVAGALDVAAKGGRVAVISFHSLEDRIIKQLFARKKEEGMIMIITKKPIIAAREEVLRNPRSRSAKLRIAEKI